MDYYKVIKNTLIKNETYKKIKDYSKNRSDLSAYYEVGKLLIKAQGGEKRAKYGDKIIKIYSSKLTIELGHGFSERSLKNMRKFYLLIKKGSTLSTQLTYSHYKEVLKLADINEINYYISLTENQNLSVRQLREKIKSKEYERLSDEVKNKLITKKETFLGDFIKDPVIIRTSKNIDYENIKESVLKSLILEDIDNFLKELGNGFSYIESEYKIKLGNTYNYIDILLFNYIFNCFVVVELKVIQLKKEHIGQVQVYMNYIDKHIKTSFQDKTIGIIICKENNNFVIRYSSDSRIKTSTYEISS